MSSNNSTPRIKLSDKRLVGFEVDRGSVAKVGAVKLGAPKPGPSQPSR